MAARKQIRGHIAKRLGILSFPFPAAASEIVTTTISTVLSTAGETDGVAVPLPVQPSPNVNTTGVITTGVKNLVQIVDATSRKAIEDGSNNEVYGRITEAASVYTLSLYSIVAGVETAFTPAAPLTINFYFPYRIPYAMLPTDIDIEVPANVIGDDPSAAFSSQVRVSELLTVTGANTLTNLSFTPDDVDNVELIVWGQSVDNFGGGTAPFSVTGVVITWSAANAGYPLAVGDRVIARYTATV
jgi:hypothetical protein